MFGGSTPPSNNPQRNEKSVAFRQRKKLESRAARGRNTRDRPSATVPQDTATNSFLPPIPSVFADASQPDTPCVALEGDATAATGADPMTAVREVRAMLSTYLPAEIVLRIIDLAEYYPVLHTTCVKKISVRASHGTEDSVAAARLYLITPPLPQADEGEFWRVKKVTWCVDGHDQGWGGEVPGKFYPAYSWYDACILRQSATSAQGACTDFSAITRTTFHDPEGIADALAPLGWAFVGTHHVWRLQSNRIAERKYEQHTISWDANGLTCEDTDAAKERGAGDGVGYVQALQPGDRLGICMRAMYPGWTNTLRSATVDVMYEIR